MADTLEFLIVDDHLDNRFLLTKTLARKFPAAIIQECQDSGAAFLVAGRTPLAAAIVHRASDMDGISLIEGLRKEYPSLPILCVSGIDRHEAAFRAGASAFLNYEAWLRVGTVVEEMLQDIKTRSPFSETV